MDGLAGKYTLGRISHCNTVSDHWIKLEARLSALTTYSSKQYTIRSRAIVSVALVKNSMSLYPPRFSAAFLEQILVGRGVS